MRRLDDRVVSSVANNEDEIMRTLSQEEIDRVSGGVSSIGEGEVGPGLRGFRIPGGYENETSLYKKLRALPRDMPGADLPPPTQMS